MLTDNTILVLAIAGVLILLAVVQLLLAARHDRAVTAAGPIEELAIYERRLEEKHRALLTGISNAIKESETGSRRLSARHVIPGM